MCTKVRQTDFTTVHHEMGHVEYYLAYKDQPSTFRAGANPGFHEAIGDTISLSVESPSYLDDIGLLKKKSLDKGEQIIYGIGSQNEMLNTSEHLRKKTVIYIFIFMT